MKIYHYLLISILFTCISACSSDDDGAPEQSTDFGESSLTLTGDYDLDLNGRAVFSMSEEEFQGKYLFRIDLSGSKEMRYNMNLVIFLESTNYQFLEGSTLPLSNSGLSNNAEAFSTDLILYGDSITDVVAEWTSIEDEGEGVGSITITRADHEIVEGSIQGNLLPKAGDASGPINCQANFRAVKNQ